MIAVRRALLLAVALDVATTCIGAKQRLDYERNPLFGGQTVVVGIAALGLCTVVLVAADRVLEASWASRALLYRRLLMVPMGCLAAWHGLAGTAAALSLLGAVR